MKHIYAKKLITILMSVVVLMMGMMCPVAAVELPLVDISTSTMFYYRIEIDNVLYDVSVEMNHDGTSSVSVTGGGENITWTTVNTSVENPLSANASKTGSYGSFRYIYSSTAAYRWNLTRPLQSDGGSSAKGVPHESGYCESFAGEVESMKAADERISDYLKNNDLASAPGTQILLGAVGGYAGFYVATSAIASTIVGAVGAILSSYLIPMAWEAAITALVELEYHNIRSAMESADYYYELA